MEPTYLSDESRRITIVSIRIPFWELAGLITKIAIAAIPAAIVLGLIGFLASLVLSAMLYSLIHPH